MKTLNIHNFSRFTEKGPLIAERVIGSKRNLSKKANIREKNASRSSELPSVFKQFNNTIHHSIKKTPIEASKTFNEKEVSSNLKDKREIRKPKLKLGQFVCTADIKRVFSKGDSTSWSYKVYTMTEVIHDTIPRFRIDYPLERYNQNLLLLTKLTLEENIKVVKELISNK